MEEGSSSLIIAELVAKLRYQGIIQLIMELMSVVYFQKRLAISQEFSFARAAWRLRCRKRIE
jgi:hypothetical protein